MNVNTGHQFSKYSQYYDTVYKQKDYPQETKFIDSVIKKFSPSAKQVLSLGCGTGTYEIELAKKGYSITGVDLSKSMLDIAAEKIAKAGMQKKIELVHNDAISFKATKTYDVAMEMFNIIGYHRTNNEINHVLENVHRALKVGGIFFFDCWYMPAVLKDPPTDRVKEVVEGGRRLIRVTRSRLITDKNIVEIKFHVISLEKGVVVDDTEEVHPMRYWSIPELDNLLTNHGFKVVKIGNFMDIETLPSENNWDMFVVARKI